MKINEIKKDFEFAGFLLVKKAEVKIASNGKYYYDLSLMDKSGVINAKHWNTNVKLESGQIVHIIGIGEEYNSKLQLKIANLRLRADGEEVDEGELLPTAPEPVDKMLLEILTTISSFEDKDYSNIIGELLNTVKEEIKSFPAAKQMHHAEKGGLLHHITTMLRMAKRVAEVYPYINKDLLFAGVIAHDIGKIYEMKKDCFGLIEDYTVDGKLIGHIVRGVVLLENAAQKTDIPKEKLLLLQHMVLSHHDMPEYGSPVPPKFPEAEVLSMIDKLDAVLFEMNDAVSNVEKGEFSQKVWGLNREVFKH